jgi:hypothetical protein
MRKRKEQNAEKRATILAIGDRQCAVGGGGSTELRRAVGRASMLWLLLLLLLKMLLFGNVQRLWGVTW